MSEKGLIERQAAETVQRLRAVRGRGPGYIDMPSAIDVEAADLIDTLQAENARLREGVERQKAKVEYFAEYEGNALNERDQARAALRAIHRVLCETRTKPSYGVGSDIEWCIDHCRTAMGDTP